MRHGISPFRLITLPTESGFASISFGYAIFTCCCGARQGRDWRRPLPKEGFTCWASIVAVTPLVGVRPYFLPQPHIIFG